MQQEEIGLQQYVEVLWRRKWAMLAVFTIVWSLAIIGIVLSKPNYKVSSLVAVKNQMYWRAPMLSFAQGTDEPDTTLSPQAYEDIINGLPFAEKVAEALLKEGMPLETFYVAGAIQAEYLEPDRIRIVAVSKKPEEAVALANAAANVFVEESKGVMMRRLVMGGESAGATQAKAQEELLTVESEIAEFHREMGFIDINGHMEGLRDKIASFEGLRGEVITRLQVAQAHLEDLRKTARLTAEQSFPLDDPRLDEYRLLQQEVQKARIHYTEDHPALRNLLVQLRSIEDRLMETIALSGSKLTPEAFLTLSGDLVAAQREIRDLETAIDSWTRQIDEVKAELTMYPGKLAKLQALEARAKASQDSYDHWTKNLEELEFKKSMVPGNASVVDLATSASPSIGKLTSLLLATMFSLLLALGVALLTEFADTTLRTAEEITETLGLSYLGSIVRIKEPQSVVFQGGKAMHQVAEAYTRVYSNIRFAEVEKPFRSILVTSARKGEGKSTTLVNLACAIAAAGKRVLIVDTDLRNPMVHRVLGLRQSLGVTSVLAGEKSLDEAVQSTQHPGLSLLAAGPIPPNPAELLHSNAMKELISAAEARADLVIFDTPPTLLVADAMLLSSELDAAIIVAESGGVSRKAVQQVKESLQKAKSRILGVVLNKVQEAPGAFYNYYSYYQAHNEDEEEAAPKKSWLKESLGSFRKSRG